jgi:hypothetical protein
MLRNFTLGRSSALAFGGELRRLLRKLFGENPTSKPENISQERAYNNIVVLPDDRNLKGGKC